VSAAPPIVLERHTERLADETFDVVVVGAGITGAWTALDCARRGLRVALVDKGDFGGATSSKSSKLLHGGIRHLQQLQFSKVRESAMEQARYVLAAPHLCRPLPFLVPTFRSARQGRTILRAGLLTYRILSAAAARLLHEAGVDVRSPSVWSKEAVSRRLALESRDLTGGVVLHEMHMTSSERMTLAVVASAHAAGAEVANYVRVERFLRADDGSVRGVRVLDLERGERFDIRAGVTVNAAGPWIPDLNGKVPNQVRPRVSGFAQGSHLVTGTLIGGELAVALPTALQRESFVDRGGRHVFIIPWRGHSLIGTSYAQPEDIDDPRITSAEVNQLLGAVTAALPGLHLSRGDVVHAFSGIYPLRSARVAPGVYQGAAAYQVYDHRRQGCAGLVSALGTKYTTARVVAEKAVDIVGQQLDRAIGETKTRNGRLACARYESLAELRGESRRRCAELLEVETIDRLVATYGSDLSAVMGRARGSDESLQQLMPERSNLVAEVEHAVVEEMAVRLEDVVFRRTGIGTIGVPSRQSLERCCRVMGRLLGWGPDRCREEVAAVESRRVGA